MSRFMILGFMVFLGFTATVLPAVSFAEPIHLDNQQEIFDWNDPVAEPSQEAVSAPAPDQAFFASCVFTQEQCKTECEARNSSVHSVPDGDGGQCGQKSECWCTGGYGS